jgi:D-tyrosyl-tRNA(Tyr) deacylase
MRVVLQRVSRASVTVEHETVASIGKGILLLVGIGKEDGTLDIHRLARRIVELRIFEDSAGKMNRSLNDIAGEILAVSQFTLYGTLRKGRRPSFSDAAPSEKAEPIFEAFVAALAAEGVPVKTGRFGAKMEVDLVNAGPVTFVFDLAPPATID